MKNGEQPCSKDCKDGHCFRGPVDPRSPTSSEEEKNGRDERSGMSDTDPKHECGDVNTPHDGWFVACDAQALLKLDFPTIGSNTKARKRKQQRHGMEPGRFEQWTNNVLCYLSVGEIRHAWIP